MEPLLQQIRQCNACAIKLKHECKPIIQASENSKVLIAGQAPGRIAHETGIAFNDASGQRLRDWLGVSESEFYDSNNFAILPMSFCYPGSGKSGDLAPLKECSLKWREQLMQSLTQVQLTIIIGRYAKQYHLGNNRQSLTEVVSMGFDSELRRFVLPHPSPRNNIWLSKHPWFGLQVLPQLKVQVSKVLSQ
ncbi:uracil-DNA glycosylase family protein [Shewanella maritima]|uniref:Uracil-DNA glycosylase family protein n=1 Tax=Shewanella maritima TaxID=2520507 RepID=A0A411PDW9_9GAMM|nr:uracil-DNA glycosylase family protein [Shewanella maritima]QBF81570.1 uracil-DNA glycosylase family protein [Shewanella maritima]